MIMLLIATTNELKRQAAPNTTETHYKTIFGTAPARAPTVSVSSSSALLAAFVGQNSKKPSSRSPPIATKRL